MTTTLFTPREFFQRIQPKRHLIFPHYTTNAEIKLAQTANSFNIFRNQRYSAKCTNEENWQRCQSIFFFRVDFNDETLLNKICIFFLLHFITLYWLLRRFLNGIHYNYTTCDVAIFTCGQLKFCDKIDSNKSLKKSTIYKQIRYPSTKSNKIILTGDFIENLPKLITILVT